MRELSVPWALLEDQLLGRSRSHCNCSDLEPRIWAAPRIQPSGVLPFGGWLERLQSRARREEETFKSFAGGKSGGRGTADLLCPPLRQLAASSCYCPASGGAIAPCMTDE